MTITYGSVCSGIEAASVAWHPMGWKAAWLAEIEPFPSAVLAHHYPDVPNLGDMTQIAAMVRAGAVAAPDVLVGGTPCQAFSIAGLRNSLDDARGQLSLSFVDLANAIDSTRAVRGLPAAVILWENVPGVLSTKDNAFGCFLAGLAGEDDAIVPAGKKWTNSGCVFGPQRTVAWRVLDAQFFGVAQRRRRVFVVASARAGFDPAAVLFEQGSVRRDTAPSREAGQGITHDVSQCLTSSGRGVERAGETRGQDPVVAVICMAHGQGGAEIASERSPTLTCNHEAPIAAYGIPGNWIGRKPENGGNAVAPMVNVAPCLTSADRHGVAYSVALRGLEGGATAELGGEVADTLRASSGGGDKAHVLAPIAFSMKDYGGDATVDLSPTLRAGNHHASHANGGQPPAIAFDSRQDCISSDQVFGALGCSSPQAQAVCITGDIAHTLKAEGFDASEDGTGRGQPIVAMRESGQGFWMQDDIAGTLRAEGENRPSRPSHVIGSGMAVRRLTPVECERLQGFPDGYTLIPFGARKKIEAETLLYLRLTRPELSMDQARQLAADGPRYKALGNSMAVPCMSWLGKQINTAINQLRVAA